MILKSQTYIAVFCPREIITTDKLLILSLHSSFTSKNFHWTCFTQQEFIENLLQVRCSNIVQMLTFCQFKLLKIHIFIF